MKDKHLIDDIKQWINLKRPRQRHQEKLLNSVSIYPTLH